MWLQCEERRERYVGRSLDANKSFPPIPQGKKSEADGRSGIGGRGVTEGEASYTGLHLCRPSSLITPFFSFISDRGCCRPVARPFLSGPQGLIPSAQVSWEAVR